MTSSTLLPTHARRSQCVLNRCPQHTALNVTHVTRSTPDHTHTPSRTTRTLSSLDARRNPLMNRRSVPPFFSAGVGVVVVVVDAVDVGRDVDTLDAVEVADGATAGGLVLLRSLLLDNALRACVRRCDSQSPHSTSVPRCRAAVSQPRCSERNERAHTTLRNRTLHINTARGHLLCRSRTRTPTRYQHDTVRRRDSQQ
jgi:hypothetical protein